MSLPKTHAEFIRRFVAADNYKGGFFREELEDLGLVSRSKNSEDYDMLDTMLGLGLLMFRSGRYSLLGLDHVFHETSCDVRILALVSRFAQHRDPDIRAFARWGCSHPVDLVALATLSGSDPEDVGRAFMLACQIDDLFLEAEALGENPNGFPRP